MKLGSKRISVIITCYNEKDNIEVLYKRLNNVFEKLPYAHEYIFVDNDSPDGSKEIFTKLASKDKNVKVIFMSRNFGSPQPSFLAGLSFAKGDAAILLHGDIQDPPELIPDFINKWEKGYGVVYGIRVKRKGYGILMNLLYKSFYYVLTKLAYIKIPLNAGEFCLMDKVVVRELLKIKEYDYYLRCLRAFVGFDQIGVEYVRDERKFGKSGENFLSSLWWAKTIIVNFSLKPLELISKIAFLVMLFTFFLIILNIILVVVYKDSPRGIPTIVMLVLFLGGVQLFSLSVIAEYLAKIFLEIKGRPRYIIKNKLNLK